MLLGADSEQFLHGQTSVTIVYVDIAVQTEQSHVLVPLDIFLVHGLTLLVCLVAGDHGHRVSDKIEAQTIVHLQIVQEHVLCAAILATRIKQLVNFALVRVLHFCAEFFKLLFASLHEVRIFALIGHLRNETERNELFPWLRSARLIALVTLLIVRGYGPLTPQSLRDQQGLLVRHVDLLGDVLSRCIQLHRGLYKVPRRLFLKLREIGPYSAHVCRIVLEILRVSPDS